MNDEINIYADNLIGKIYGAYTLLHQAYAYNGYINSGILYAEPNCSFRGLKVYMPAPDNLESFYKTVDMLLYYRYNKIIIEVGGAMESYKLLFDVLGEVIDVFDPATLHIGHDEYYSIGVCERCKGKDGAEIYASDIKKIYNYLKDRNIRTMLWAEKLINAIGKAGQPYGGSEYRYRHQDGQIEIRRPATYHSIDMIPNDIIAHHWYWGIREGFDDEYLKRGFELVYGNFSPHCFLDWNRRLYAGAKGGSPSHWSSLCEDTLQRNGVLLELVYGTYLFWGMKYDDDMYKELLKKCFNELYLYKNREIIKKAHFEIIHTTNVKHDYVYISSLPMQVEKDTIGTYCITYDDGTEFEIPIVYGLNISNRERFWTRSLGNQNDKYEVDKLLIEVSYTTLPMQIDNDTYFKFTVENPYPDKKVKSIYIYISVKELMMILY